MTRIAFYLSPLPPSSPPQPVLRQELDVFFYSPSLATSSDQNGEGAYAALGVAGKLRSSH